MVWFKVDDNLAFHHKAVAAGNAAMGLWVRAGSFCSQQLTDGFVADHMVTALGTRTQAEALVSARLWDRVDGGFMFHEWGAPGRQPTREQVENDRAEARERMQKRRSSSGDVQANRSGTSGGVRGPRPDPTTDSKESDSLVAEPPRAEIIQLCEQLADWVEKNESKRPNVGKTWLNDCRLMLDVDGRDPVKAAALIDWCQRDSFWKSNVMSMRKFRQQYDQMRLKALAEHEQAKATAPPSGWQLPDPPAGMEVGGAEWQAWRLEQQNARRSA